MCDYWELNMTYEQAVYFNRIERLVTKAEARMNQAFKSGVSKRAMHCSTRYSRLACFADKIAYAECANYA